MDMVLKIMSGGNACFQHLKSVTSPLIKLHSSLATKPNLVSRQAFFQKDSYGHYLSYATLATYVS